MNTMKNLRSKARDNLEELYEEIPESEEKDKKIADIQDKDDKIIKKEQKFRNFQKFIFNLILLIFIVWLLFFVFLGMMNAPNDDMSPMVKGGDLVFYYRINKTPAIGDVIILKKKNIQHIGRVVARGGDTVEIHKKGGVIVNGNKLVEHNIYKGTLPYEQFVKYPITLKTNEYFVLVDDRAEGEDSRFYGTVKRKEIKGIVIGLFRRTNL